MDARLKPSYHSMAEGPSCRVPHVPSMTRAVLYKQRIRRRHSSAQGDTGGGLQSAIAAEPPVEEGEHLTHPQQRCVLVQGQATLVNFAVYCLMIHLYSDLAVVISVVTTSTVDIRGSGLLLRHVLLMRMSFTGHARSLSLCSRSAVAYQQHHPLATKPCSRKD